MRVLADTCVVIWALTEPERIPTALMATLARPGVTLLVSAVSAWEMAVKQSIGKLVTSDARLDPYGVPVLWR